MAITQNTYTGNGSTVLYSFTFPYLETTDVKVTVNGTTTTAYTFANATTIQFNTAPANGAAIRIYRDTDDASLAATFYSGSAIRAQDLNDNFTQNLYVTQEVNNNSVNIDGSNPMVGPLNMNGFQIDNLAAPTSNTDAATKQYVDNIAISGLPNIIPSANVVLTQVGTGAVQRTVESKLRDVVSVKDFGAVGDGVTNDTAAIQAAINQAPVGSTILVPAGQYKVTSTLNINRDVSLQGVGESGSKIIAEHTSPNTDLIVLGNIDETRIGVGIRDLGLEFKNSNTRNVIHTISYTSKLTLERLDIRSYNSNFGVVASGAAIKIAGVGTTAAGLNDWPTIQHCYLAFCANGLVASGTNIINMRFTQNTTASIRNESILWTTGGQSIIDNNTFQYSNLNATGSSRVYTLKFEGGPPGATDAGNITIGPGNSFQANGGGGIGFSTPKTWEILVKDCPGMNIVENQFSGASPSVNYGAYHAIEFIGSFGTVYGNTFGGYNRTGTGDTDPGPCEYDYNSRVSHYNNVTDDYTTGGSDFTTACSTAALRTTVSGALRLENKNTTPFFSADPVSGVTDVSFLRIGNSDTFGKLAAGVAQLGSPAAGQRNVTLSWANPSTTKVFCQLANSSATEYLAVTVNTGSFNVYSNVASGSYFYWFAVDGA